MPPITRSAFARRLRRLDDEEFAAFVAALYRARGWAVEREGDRLSLRDGDRTRDLALHRESRLRRRTVAPGDADAVVTNSRDAAERLGARAVGPDDLRGMALYAIDRDRAGELVSEHLGRPLVAPAPDRPLRDAVADAGTVYALVAVVGALALLAGLGAGLLAPGAVGDAGEAPTGPTTAPPAPETATIGAAATTAARTPTAPTPVPPGEYPEGLGPQGVTDPGAVAAIHGRLVANRSYDLWLVRWEYSGETLLGTRSERMTVASPTRYVSSVAVSGSVTGTAPVVSDAARYADGSTVYTRTLANGTPSYERYPINATGTLFREGPQERLLAGSRVERALRWALTARETEIRTSYEQNGTDFYWVTATGEPYPGIDNSTSAVLVDENGLVHRFRRTYTRPGTNRSIVVRFRYFYDDVSVEAPYWLRAARNHTAATVTPRPTP